MTKGKSDQMHAGRPKYVTVTEAARHFRVSRNTIYDACRENEIDFIKVRTSLRVLVDLSEKYLTVAETADYLHISPSTVYEACSVGCNYGQLPHIRVRSRIRIPLSRLIKHSRANASAGREDAALRPGMVPAAANVG